MKNILTILLLAVPALTKAEKADTLKEVQIVGIVSGKDLPISQTNFNCDEYSYLNKQGDPFFVVASATPSIYSQSDNGQENGYSYMRMRGLDQTRINYNLNGIPLNEMEDQGLYFSNMPGFYNYLGSVNVERGIGSSKYGNTSVAGSVDMQTRSMQEQTLEITSLLKDSYNDQNANFFYSSGINKEGLAIQLGGSLIRNSGFKEHSNNDGGAGYYSLAKFSKHNIIKLYGFNGLAHNQLAFYGVPMSVINLDYKANLNLTSDKDTFNQNLVAINWVNYANAKHKFNSTAYFDNVNGAYSTSNVLYGVNSKQFGIMSNMVMEQGGVTTNIGVNANVYSRSHFGSDSMGYYGLLTNPNYYTNVGHKEDVIAYIKGESRNRVSLFYDIQFRDVWFSTTNSKTYNWAFVNPKIGATFSYLGNNLYLNAGMTEREPTRTDMIQNIVQTNGYSGANTDNSQFFDSVGILKLKPETVYDVELGNKYHSSSLDVNANAYLMTIDNEYVATGIIDPYSGFMTKQAVPLTLRGGLEMDARAHLGYFSLFFNGNLQHSSIGSVAGIPFAPNYIASLGLSYKRSFYNVGFIEQAVSSMIMNLPDASNPVLYKSTPYQISNAFVDVKIHSVTLSLKVNNLLNNKYYVPAGIYGIPTYYVGQLANYSISLKWKI